ncbi:MAG: hypothetical protein MHMPM18_001514 [Marteilia pararefringens]
MKTDRIVTRFGTNSVPWLESPFEYLGCSRRISRRKNRVLWENEKRFWEVERMSNMLKPVEDLKSDKSTVVYHWTQLVPAANKRIAEVRKEIEEMKSNNNFKPYIAVWRVKKAQYLNTKIQKILEEFDLLEKKYKINILLNSQNVSKKLLQIKSVIAIKYLDATVPNPEDYYPKIMYKEEDKYEIEVGHNPQLQLTKNPDISVDNVPSDHLEFEKKWELEERTVLKRLRILKDKSLLFKEYYPTTYKFNGRMVKTLPTRKGEISRENLF